MQRNIITIEDATREWVREFNAIPQSVIMKMQEFDVDSVYELTTPDEYDDFLPMWSTMWTFGESLDEDWARENIQVMQDCGFRVYENEDFGIIFGIDGAGYNFYENHSVPTHTSNISFSSFSFLITPL